MVSLEMVPKVVLEIVWVPGLVLEVNLEMVPKLVLEVVPKVFLEIILDVAPGMVLELVLEIILNPGPRDDLRGGLGGLYSHLQSSFPSWMHACPMYFNLQSKGVFGF